MELYTTSELKDILKVSRTTLYNWIKAGKLKASKVGKSYRITDIELKRLLKGGR